jgi:hypothetical protein
VIVGALWAVVLLPWFSGCDSLTAFGPGQPAAAQQPKLTRANAFAVVARGMTAAEVRTLLGEPRDLNPYTVGGTNGETWIYERKIDETIRQVPISSRDVPRFNPFTLQTEIIQEPVMGEEFTTLFEHLELMLVGDRVIDISRWPRVEQHINN